uniref:Transmembrane BAX inhibitor motif-containing protein 6 n=1 Tax=Pundamilia nyererei TaxID=303518 RepID=A0A3B4F552_9CICH
MFNRNVNARIIFDLSHISHSTRLHLIRVYASLALCTTMALAGACLSIATVGLSVYDGLVVMCLLGSVVAVFLLGVTTHSPVTEVERFSGLLGLSVSTGFTLGAARLEASADPNVVAVALAGTTLLFALCTLSALYFERRVFLLVGGVLPVLFIMFLLTTLDIVTDMDTHLGVLLYCVLIVMDTQVIIEKADAGDTDYIWHCVGLFLDIAEMFRKITAILGRKTNSKGDTEKPINKCAQSN